MRPILFWNTLSRTENPVYTCWICMDDEEITNRSIKGKWIQHSCGCNLQLHKQCYLRYISNLLKPTYVEECDVDEDENKLYWRLFDLKRTFLFQIVDTNTGGMSRPNIFERYLPERLYHLGAAFTLLLKFPLFAVNPYTAETWAWESVYRAPPIPKNTCPQCHKDFVPNGTHFIKDHSTILALYFKVQNLIKEFLPLCLPIAAAINPRKLIFKLGLHQLRSLFPESILRIILNTSATKAMDVFGETSHGIHTVSSRNRYLIMGLPFYMQILVSSKSTSSVITNILFDQMQYSLYPLIFSSAVLSIEGVPKGTATLISNCVLYANTSILLYKKVICPLYRQYLYDPWVKESQSKLLYPPEREGDGALRDSLRIGMRGGTMCKSFTNYYYRVTSLCDEILRAGYLWPAVSKLLSDKVLDKFIPALSTLPLQWLQDASPDEIKMCINFVSYGIVGISYCVMNAALSKQRIEEVRLMSDEVDVIIADEEYEVYLELPPAEFV